MGTVRLVYRPPRLPVRDQRARARRGRRVRRLRGRAVQRPPSRRARSATRSSRTRAPAASTPSWRSALGVQFGPDFGRLQRGETVNGVAPEQVVGPERPGRKVVLSGDTAPCDMLRVAAHEADVLVHEATFTDEELERAAETGHSTARQAAELAAEARGRAARAHPPLDALRRPRDPRRGARGLRQHRSSRATSTRSRCPFPRRASPSCVRRAAARADCRRRSRPVERSARRRRC